MRKRQRLLPFMEASLRRERLFRTAILLITALAILAMLFGSRAGRAFLRGVPDRASRVLWWAERGLGIEPERKIVQAAWARRRQAGIETTRQVAIRAFSKSSNEFQELLRAGGLMPDQAVIRWGNYNLTFVLSSAVFEPDDSGRSYRFRPSTRSVWVKQLVMAEPNTGQLLVPDTPQVREAAHRSGSQLLSDRSQTTNSWGCRGAEPDLSATVRGIVLGDSYMQGLLLREDETPPAQLKQMLSQRLSVSVSVLNTGVLGYSPEQYYFTLSQFIDKMKPSFVIASFFANDFGNEFEALAGRGEWTEGAFWLQEIQRLCRLRGALCLLVPVVCEPQMVGSRRYVGYPGRVADLSLVLSSHYLDPIEAFLNEHLRVTGRPVSTPSPLFNGDMGDGHYSPLGAATWASAVAERVELLLRAAKGVARE